MLHWLEGGLKSFLVVEGGWVFSLVDSLIAIVEKTIADYHQTLNNKGRKKKKRQTYA
jgi:hypothetical protein